MKYIIKATDFILNINILLGNNYLIIIFFIQKLLYIFLLTFLGNWD